mgnify:CR=1 FL=1
MTRQKLKPQVILLGFVSLLNDSASEMIYPLLPLFLTGSLGVGPCNRQRAGQVDRACIPRIDIEVGDRPGKAGIHGRVRHTGRIKGHRIGRARTDAGDLCLNAEAFVDRTRVSAA